MTDWVQKKWPTTVNVVEVGPRDGFQNITEFITTEDKVAIIKGLVAAGAKWIEITSFVHPKAIPQMADAAKVATSVISDSMIGSFIPIALVPNLVGAKAAWDIGLKEITYVISASEKHNQANVNRSIDESLAGLEKISNQYPEMNIRLDMATAFGCPFAGKTPDQSVVDLAKKGLERGAKEIVLCDTIGVANPFQVNRVCARMLAEFPETPLAVHLHDTRGMGLANTLAAMAAGVAIVETSVGGLGGCPFAPGAAGNSATEDLINMLMSMNIECGLNLEAYLAVVGLVREKTTGRVTDHLSQACLYGGLTF